MKIKNTMFFLIIVLASFACQTQSQQMHEPEGRRLRDIVAEKYSDASIIVGATIGEASFGTNTGIILDEEFSYVTPENDFKQWMIHPDNKTWNWKEPDSWIEHIKENDQILRMHGPIGPQCSPWAQDDNRTAAELDSNMNDFMIEFCKRYNGTPGFIYMDVVNEIVMDGKWHMDKPDSGWECPWYKIGLDTDSNQTPLYIKRSFEIANKYAPDVKQILNHHMGPEFKEDWDLLKETIFYLRNMGLRVDGIGWQAHVDNGWANEENLKALKDLIDWSFEHDLEFHVTEASVWMKEGNSIEDKKLQGETYSAILKILLEKRYQGVVGWNTWHVDDSIGWELQYFPSIFDSNYVAKPAYYAIQKVLEEG